MVGTKKRKQLADDAPPAQIAPTSTNGTATMDLPSDDEDDAAIPDDEDAPVEEFPELDDRSDDDEEDPESDDIEHATDSNEENELDEEEYQTTDSEGDDSIHPFPRAKTIVSDITGVPKRVYPEIEPDYDSDSSTEDAPNRVGNVPMHWYDDLPHVGYSIDGKKVLRPARGDELDRFLSTVEDPSAWTSAFDKTAQTDRPLTAEELDIIRRLHANEVTDANYDPYEPTVEWFTGKGKEEIMPLSAAPEPKRRWVPSKWEKKKVMKIVRLIRAGKIIPHKPKASSHLPQFHNIWSSTSDSSAIALIPAPKPPLPTNAESYNPPEEYLPTQAEREAWEALDPEDREKDYLPQKYSSLRLVPAYEQFIKQRFNRQLDIYLAPRIQRKKLNIDPETLIPKLPSPNSLRPFPLYRSLRTTYGKGKARCMSVSPDGGWVVCGYEDGVVRLWETGVGREVKRWSFGGEKVEAVEWCPRGDVSFFVVGVGQNIHFIVPPFLPPSTFTLTKTLLAPPTLPPAPAVPSPVKWVSKYKDSTSTVTSESTAPTGYDVSKPILTLELPPGSSAARQISWHRKGDYFASVSNQPGGSNQGALWIHQLSRRHSQAPFKTMKGSVQLVLFHPTKPHFFVATQRYIRIYNLAEQKLLKTLMPGIRWISSMDVHPLGDHLIVGGYDKKLCWFDLELSDKPYKILRYHTRAIRSLHFHPTYPLFASSSDDGSIQIFHARVYNDLMTDPLIVPLKILRGHDVTEGLGVLGVRWVRGLPWLVSAGADGTVAVWCN